MARSWSGVNGGRHRRPPFAGAGRLPVGQQGRLRLLERLVQVPAVIVEHPVGVQHLLGPRGLGADAPHGLLVAQAVAFHEPFEPHRLRSLHHPERVEDMGLAPLNPEGRVQHHALDSHGQGRQAFGEAGLDARVQQRLQLDPLGRVGEHQPGQSGAVQGPVRPQDPVAEGQHQLGQPRRAGLHHVPGHLVGVDHHPLRGGQADGGVGLAGGDAPGEPDDGVGGLGEARVQAGHCGKLQGQAEDGTKVPRKPRGRSEQYAPESGLLHPR
jgi:hypothetical protein